MYRILIADDEGLMLEAFKGVILAEFGDKCSVETAKTGRAVIEKAETFHPDIVFMDIHMPGINGIQAMREIRKFNNSALFYVVSAYDKFDYAKEAINLGVEQYLTKPISKSKIISVVEEATAKVDKVRDQRSNLLKIQEKLETVIPVVESGYVNSLLFQKEMAAADYYQQLLDIEYGQGYVMVVQFGQSYENGRLVSPVGMNVKAQSFYPEFRDVVKSAFPCVVGNIMSNRIPVVVPCEIFQNPYEDRIDLVEKARELVARLEGRLDAKFRVGIGRVWEMEELERSYREALRALNGSLGRVIHIEDLSQNGVYDEAFPGNDERSIYLEKGRKIRIRASQIFRELTDGKYIEFYGDEGQSLELCLEEGTVLAENLEKENLEMLYFSIQMAAAELFTNETVFPVILDDIFHGKNQDKLMAVFRWLKKQPRQVLLFTNNKDMADIF